MLLGGAVDAERAREAVRPQRGGAEPFRQPPGAVAAHGIHLEQAILRMDEAEREGGIAVISRGDDGDALLVAADAHLGDKPGEDEAPVLDRQRGAQPEKTAEQGEDRQEQQKTEL